MSISNPELPRFIMENLESSQQLQPPPTDNVFGEQQKPITSSDVVSYLQRFHPNLTINHLVIVSRIHSCHNFVNYLHFLMWQLADDKDI